MLLLASEEIRVDARLLCHIVVLHQFDNLVLKPFGIQALVLESPVKPPQSTPFIGVRYFGKTAATRLMTAWKWFHRAVAVLSC